tara:strand:- start:307672 stop:308211 length:540 start_codon:yes stop_codon:yes gene_type:complete
MTAVKILLINSGHGGVTAQVKSHEQEANMTSQKTDKTFKSNDNKAESVILPLPPLDLKDKVDMEIYARFMRHLRYVANSRMEVKVLSAIQFTADMMDIQDAQVARILLDMGLRAPRLSFPNEFLEFADNARSRDNTEFGSAGETLQELYAHWTEIGEDQFIAVKREYAVFDEGVFTNTL